jgi:hypothetical protein
MAFTEPAFHQRWRNQSPSYWDSGRCPINFTLQTCSGTRIQACEGANSLLTMKLSADGATSIASRILFPLQRNDRHKNRSVFDKSNRGRLGLRRAVVAELADAPA